MQSKTSNKWKLNLKQNVSNVRGNTSNSLNNIMHFRIYAEMIDCVKSLILKIVHHNVRTQSHPAVI